MSATPCYLTVLAHLTDEQIETITPLLSAMNCDDMDVAEALSENSVLRFDAIFEGTMPIDLLRWFSDNEISYVWQWEGFYQTGEGAQYFDAEIDEVYDLRIHEGLVVLPITQAVDPAKVEALHGTLLKLSNELKILGINRSFH